MKKKRSKRLDGPDADRARAAATSASKAAMAGKCGQALDDLIVAVALHHGDIHQSRAVTGDAASWRSLQAAKALVRQNCLVNVEGRGLHGPRRRPSR